MEERYEELKKIDENHFVMQKNMWSIDAAIRLAASSCFANVEIMAISEEISVGPTKEVENSITINIIMNTMEDTQKLEKWLPHFIQEQKKSLELETHISDWTKKVDGFYGIRFIFAENSEDTINYKVKIRISSPVLDCIGALELCGKDFEVKRLMGIYNFYFIK
ncbi:unknown [Clostridium sp. CAG:356]|nr:unknown [Clostridium sp. CAG:356]